MWRTPTRSRHHLRPAGCLSIKLALLGRTAPDSERRPEPDARGCRALRHFERVALVKVDVEGAENQVLVGMEQLLASGVVKRVSFEISRAHMGDDWENLTERLKRFEHDGWMFSTISEAGEPEPIALTDVFERGRFSQILMQRENV
jgi:hypothetical protein